VSRGRQKPLTDAETVRLGRRLVSRLGVEHVSYPDGEPFVVVQIWGTTDALPEQASAAIEEVIGPFDVVVVAD
jgi:hypothetical protein